MLLSYAQCLKQYSSDYKIAKALENKELFKLEKGIYSDSEKASELDIIICKYPNTIFTMDSAFYYHGLTDVIPDAYHIATISSAKQLRDKRIKQYFIPEKIFNLGVTTMIHRNSEIKIYSKERMLIELLRFKNALPYDYYKEILNNYRDSIYDLDVQAIEEFAKVFPKSKMIMGLLRDEVF